MKPKIRDNEGKYIGLEFAAVAFLATAGIWVKLSSLPPIATGFYRLLFSLPLLLPLTYRHLKKLSKKDVLILLFAGVFLAGDIALWNLSFNYTSVANANLLANLTPFTVIPASYFLFKEKIPKSFLAGAAITLIGVFVLLGGKASPSASNYFGDFLAFSASFFYAGFLLISYHLRDRIESSVIMFVSGFGSTITLFVISIFSEGVQLPKTFNDFWPLIMLAITIQLIGHNLMAHCQGKVSVNLSSVICLTQPAIATVYAFFVFGEKISIMEIAGIIIVIGGVYIAKNQYSSKNIKKEKGSEAVIAEADKQP